MTRDEDIFADDTDIFADLPSSKSRSKKAKPSTGQTKSLFSSDDVGQCTMKCSSQLEFNKNDKRLLNVLSVTFGCHST